MKMFRLVLGITLFCLFLPRAGPPDVSATFPIDLGGGLFLDTSGAAGTCNPCDLGTVQFIVTDIIGLDEGVDQADDLRFEADFAKVAVSVEAIVQQNLVEFEYRYQIIDPQFAINLSLLFPFIPAPNPLNDASKDSFGNFKILSFGSIPDGDPNTVAPLVKAYTDSGIFVVAFASFEIPFEPFVIGEGPITPAKTGSDVLFIRSSLSPVDIAATIDGGDFPVFVSGFADIKGPGSEVPPVKKVEQATASLQEIIDSNPGSELADKVEDALAGVQSASMELAKTPPDNQAAVGNIEGAVGDLQAVIDAGLLDPELGTLLMDQLSGITRQLALIAINQAIGQAGDPDKIAEFEQALAKGDSLRMSAAFEDCGCYKDTVNEYKDALATAESLLD